MKKQKGFGLIETILSLSVLSLAMVWILQGVTKYNQIKTANAYAKHIELVINQLQKYQNYMVLNNGIDPVLSSVWPANLDGLMNGSKFWPQCSLVDEQAHRCVRPDTVPWSAKKLGYKVLVKLNEQSKAELTIPSPPSVWAAPLKRIPFAITQGNGDIKITIGDPLLSQAFKEFLRKDGSTSLTGDWDVGGNNSILNARNISVVGNNGTQRQLGVRYIGDAKSGTRIRKIDNCPSGSKPDLIVTPKMIGATSKKYSIRDVAQWFLQKDDTNPNWWTVHIYMNVKDAQYDNKWREIEDGWFSWEVVCVPK